MKRVRIIGEVSATNVARERWGREGETLGSCLAETVNGVDYRIDDPFGETHMVSLAPFAGHDLNKWLVFRFVVSRDNERFRDRAPNGVVLKEYDLPPDAELPEVTRRGYGDGSGTLLKQYELPPGVKMIEL
jgi:hypothetical protein